MRTVRRGQSALWGKIGPAESFMLAARGPRLRHCLDVRGGGGTGLGIPYAQVTQGCLIPVAYAQDTDFKSVGGKPPTSIVHWEKLVESKSRDTLSRRERTVYDRLRLRLQYDHGRRHQARHGAGRGSRL